MMPACLTVSKFVRKTLDLLEKEREAEIEETRALTERLPAKELQRRGVCLLKLHVTNRRSGLYGRTIATFESNRENLPSHSITPGDITGLSLSHGDSQSEDLASGIVTRVSQSAVSVAFDDGHDVFLLEENTAYKLTKLANDVTYKRLKRTLEELESVATGSANPIVPVLFGEDELAPPAEVKDLDFVNSNLDNSQQEAVQFALSQKNVAVIHGPPGTGKTTTVIEIILQSVRQGNKILACAPSNIAVDNLVERLASSKHKIVRIGHPARLLPHIQQYSLDAILSSSDETRLVEDVRKDLDSTLGNLRKTRNHGEKQKLREDMKYLRKELKTRAETATRDILKRADVVLVTLTSATEDGPIKLLNEHHFDIVVIDECSQALEAACWIPLLRARKCVLSGDHLQLPPTILSKQAASAGLELTLMERVLDLHGDGVMKMLTTQYRMNTGIMQWSSSQLYQSRLVAHSSVAAHLLRELAGVEDTEETGTALLMIDTAGCDLTELDLPEEISKGNEGEADLVAAHVCRLVECGVRQEDIGVITPYNLQVELIRLRLAAEHYSKVEVKSVDGFQGREKEAIVISLVRSNAKREVGFLAERRRINVAVTRARRHLAVIGDSETMGKNEFLRSLIDYMSQEGEVHTAHSYIQEGKVHQSKVARPDHLDSLISVTSSPAGKGARPKSSKASRNKTQKEHTKKDITITKPGKQHNRNTREVGELEASDRVQELQAMLEDFISDVTMDTLECPASFTSHDRFLIHELSEKMGLTHVSRGCDSERCIVVSKHGAGNGNKHQRQVSDDGSQPQYRSRDRTSVSLNKNISGDTSDKADHVYLQTEVVEESSATPAECSQPVLCRSGDSGKPACQYCGKYVIKANIQLHELHCAKNQRAKSASTAVKKEKSDVSKSSKPRQMDKELARKINKVDKDDFDALLETVQKADNYCCFRKCKCSIQTLCNLCEFCQGRYCLEHHMPEVHGCGDAAKARARAQIIRDGVLYKGSGVPNKKPDQAKKMHLQRKLDHKLTEMAAKRKGKPKKSN